jgi:ABC-type transport system substrate-binding protein
VANDLIGPPVFLPSGLSGGAHTTFGLVDWGFFEYLIRANHSDPPNVGAPGDSGIASSWELAPDGSALTFKIRQGVQFHNNMGELTAHDVAFSLNESAKPGSKNPRGPAMLLWTETWEAIDDRTAVMKIKPGKLDPTWPLSYGNHGGGSVPLVSKKLYDQKGEEEATRTAVGTGPFKVVSWESGEEIRGEAVVDHYRGTPKLANLRIVQISEVAAKIAALKAGEVDMGALPVAFLKETQAAIPGSRLQLLGVAQAQLISFGGNYWAKTGHDGANIYRQRPGFKPDAEHPWIGDPDDPARMESARKVRWAMSLAIDRALLNKEVFDELGTLAHTHTDWPDNDPSYKQDWVVPFDAARAKQLMTEAGYPNGFKFTMWVAPDNTAAVDPEIGQAVAQMWRANLNLDVTVEKTAYAARRPTLVARSIDIPWQHHTFGLTTDEPKGGVFVPSAGFNLGVEAPDDIVALRWANATEPDREKRIQNNIKIQDYLTQWMLVAMTVKMQPHWLVRSTVAEWRPHQLAWSMFNSPETVVMK